MADAHISTPEELGSDPKPTASYSENVPNADAEKGYRIPDTAHIEHVHRRLLLKTDLAIMPLTALLYWLASLDRGNLGNARLQGLPQDILGGDPGGGLFALCSSLFYISYILCQVPANLIVKRFDPAVVIGISVFLWGVASSSQAGARNFGGELVCRLFIGVFEAGFGPAIPLYYSYFYTRAEHGKRTALFIGSAAFAGAFGGLIAYGVQSLSSPPIAHWRILFLIEGLPTCIVGLLTIWLLPNRPAQSRIYTAEEKAVIGERLGREVQVETDPAVRWAHVKGALGDWRVWVMGMIYQSLNLALGSISSFLPTIINTLTPSPARAQLLTVPPYAAAFGTMLVSAFISDHLAVRGPLVALLLLVSGFGFMMLLIDHTHFSVRYGGTFLACMGTYTGVPLMMSWCAANYGSETKRAVALALMIGFGQCFSVVASFIWPTTDSPFYRKGFILCMTWSFFGAALAALLSTHFRLTNLARDRREGRPEKGATPQTGTLADKAPGFRYMW
ncbi:MFS general substrate transporter [Calocera viscosa TUFC12733]|uniref:MFS general substrate transporter n=1 Tax=Calocera viscosa (strain TUFC12733) TaxID=1330018 RepID=A0A167R9G2_CALVF|nr:MFS general substrate transporter [Calocera viscosa TUFC12733]